MTADSKPRVAFYWCGACGGCEEAVLDLGEQILEVVAAVDIVFWPVALDFKRKHVEALPDGDLAFAFINGAICTTEQEEMSRLLRRKAQAVVAFGACAHMGGVIALANLFSRDEVFSAAYRESPSTVNPEGVLPQAETAVESGTLELPALSDSVRALDQVIDVDYYLPGCPPTAKLLQSALGRLLGPERPPRGTVLAPDRALCEECPRRDSKPQDLAIERFKQLHETLVDEEACLLAQGILCLGPATRAGCEARCVAGNMPCTGCLGPTSRTAEFGAKALSGASSLLKAQDEDGIRRALSAVPDPIGAFYRYSFASSMLGRIRAAVSQR